MTKIEWTERTWNPTVGCTAVSPGCDRCYAAAVAHRGLTEAHRGLTRKAEGGLVEWTGEVRCLPERLGVPLAVRKPTMWFVDSMSDLFHPRVKSMFVAQVWATMARTPQHTYQVLTKRTARAEALLNNEVMRAYVEDFAKRCDIPWPLPNVWLGTSIESDDYLWRADALRRTPAAVRFLSIEPMLGPLLSLTAYDLDGIDWVIVGGESGPGARPMHPDWVRDIRDLCVTSETPFFFKQWGAWGPVPASTPASSSVLGHGFFCADQRWLGATGARATTLPETGEFVARVGKARAGRELDGRTWDEMPARVTT